MLPCKMRSSLTSARCFSPFVLLPSFLSPFPSCVPSLLPTSLRHRGTLKTALSFTTQLPDSEDSPTLTTPKGKMQAVVGGRQKKKKKKVHVTQSRKQDTLLGGGVTTTGRTFLPCLARLAIPSKGAFLCGKNTHWSQTILK